MNGKHKIITLVLVAFFALSFNTHFAHALVKDSDVDGLSDDAEIRQYRTNPQIFDTDGDGRGDGDEILDRTDPLDRESSYIATLIRQDPGIFGNPNQWAWYLGRASGILALILLTSVVSFGLVVSSRAFFKIVPGATAYEVHRFVAWLALGAVVFHFSTFFFDGFIKMTVAEALIPFALFRELKTVTGFSFGTAVAFGTIAFYGLLVLVFTSQWRSKMSPKLWRVVHSIAFVTYLLFILHGFMAGTDSEVWWMRVLYSLSLGLVTFLVFVRIISRNVMPTWRAWRKRENEGTEMPREG
ncbi:MAG: ferric reductase-like transmembrane domain-containing protein [Candidatus Moranbacteria bacterium]|nr:ferric reductase-like transmembrane domain-containing protein [Candidatus Moranbacteria bacterium]